MIRTMNLSNRTAKAFIGLAALVCSAARADFFYISNAADNTIEKFDSDGNNLGAFASTGLSDPHGLAFDSSGNLSVANFGDNTLTMFSSTGAVLSEVSTGANPFGLAFDSNGDRWRTEFSATNR